MVDKFASVCTYNFTMEKYEIGLRAIRRLENIGFEISILYNVSYFSNFISWMND